MESASRIRVLVLADLCNPDWPSLPVVGYNYAVALSERCDVTVVTQIRNTENIRARRPTDTPALRFDFVDTEYVARPLHRLASRLRGDPEVAWSTSMAMAYLPYLEFERQAWKRHRDGLRRGDFDVVHRITPMSPTMPSWMAGKPDQPFVVGPLNGNLDWPAAFAAEQQREKEGLRRIRRVARHLPYAQRTWRHSDRVLAAFQHTIDDLTDVPTDRITPFPEVGYDEAVFYPPQGWDQPAGAGRPLTFLFAGRLVPYKLPEVALRAFCESPVLREEHRLVVVGDGPERERLDRIMEQHDHPSSVTLIGRLDQKGVAETMRHSDVFVFPSIRELGAGVVVEAMACGLPCLVVDYGGPADLVADDRGVKVPMAPLDELISSFRVSMEGFASQTGSDLERDLRQGAVQFAQDNFRWQSKAALTEQIYRELLTSAGVDR